MRAKMLPIPAGSLFTVTSGEYSDYSVRGVFRALAAINADALRSEYLAERPEQAVEYCFREDQFLGWVARKGLIEAVDCFEWHLCNYSRASEMDVSKMDAPALST